MPVPRELALLPAGAVARRRGGCRHTASVTLTERRLKEFMQAEIGYFAGMSAQPVELARIFKASTPELAAELILRQLPIHFATRIKHIEALCEWGSVPELVQVRNTLAESFQKLRLLETSATNLEPLTLVIHDQRQRHKAIVPLLGVAMGDLRHRGLVSEADGNKWLDEFLLARISTEMCTLHYIMLVNAGQETQAGRRGIIDPKCDPSEICRQAVVNVQRDPRYRTVPMPVESWVCRKAEKGIEFSFLPQYLLMIVEELIKNSASASVMRTERDSRTSRPKGSSGSGEYPPVCVFVGADDTQVMIEVSDKGGGITSKNFDSIWSYSSTQAPERPSGASSTAEERLGMSWADPLSGLGIKQRLGMGLPLTRLYTQYLGGSLELMSIPGVGVDTFINLKRIDPDEIRARSPPAAAKD